MTATMEKRELEKGIEGLRERAAAEGLLDIAYTTAESPFGPLLLARILDLNDIQTGVLTLTFKVADDAKLLLLDMKDLRAMLQHVGENAKEYGQSYGNVSPASIGAIQRSLLALEQQGGERFFGEPALDLMDLLKTDHNGKGQVSILAADELLKSPRLYSTFLLWLLSELFERLPEVGDLEKPTEQSALPTVRASHRETPPHRLCRSDLLRLNHRWNSLTLGCSIQYEQ